MAKKKGNVPARAGVKKPKGALSRAIARFKDVKKERTEGIARRKRLGFLIDATGSRAPTWALAQKIQGEMFASAAGYGLMALRLVHFGGGIVSDHGWKMDARAIAEIMKRVTCRTGYTEIVPGLRLFLSGDLRPQAVILVGDAFEEDVDQLAGLARELKAADIKVFAFIEGENERAANAFRTLAGITGGTFATFGAALPLRDLCQGVALLTAGGRKALSTARNEKVRRLLLTGPAKGKE